MCPTLKVGRLEFGGIEIFGFNGWSSELISVQVDFLDSAWIGESVSRSLSGGENHNPRRNIS